MTQKECMRFAYRLAELAQASGLSLSFLRAEIRKGRISAKKVGGAVVVLAAEFERYLEAAQDWHPGQPPKRKIDETKQTQSALASAKSKTKIGDFRICRTNQLNAKVADVHLPSLPPGSKL